MCVSKLKTQMSLLSFFLSSRILAQSLTCISSGVDFWDGGTYFQNSLSADQFTFVSAYQGCRNDTAKNLLIDPTGIEYECSNTPLQPENTPELSTCPIRKMDLASGLWSILIVSNNADGEPVAYERDFSLSVGPQATKIHTPTVTLPTTVTPIFNRTSISTFTSTTVLPPLTITKPSTTLHPTVTSTPKPVTTTKTVTLLTLTINKPTLSVKEVFSTVMASCITPTRAFSPDPTATITPTAITAAALETTASDAQFRRHLGRRVSLDRHRRLKARAERFIEKRAPDIPTVTMTETDTAKFVTSISTSIAPTRTVTVISVTTVPATSTPSPVTTFSGVSTDAVVTVTAPTVTKSKTNYVIFGLVTKKVTVTATVTIKTTTTPTALAASCTGIGGKIS